jgi:hypothetical protein
MDKEEFHWLFGVVQGWFPAKLGSKISDGSQLSAQFPWPPTDTWDITKNRNQSLFLDWTYQYGAKHITEDLVHDVVL